MMRVTGIHIPKVHIHRREPACFPGLSELAGRHSRQSWMAARENAAMGGAAEGRTALLSSTADARYCQTMGIWVSMVL